MTYIIHIIYNLYIYYAHLYVVYMAYSMYIVDKIYGRYRIQYISTEYIVLTIQELAKMSYFCDYLLLYL